MGVVPDTTIRVARVGEAQMLGALALRSKAHWGYSPEFLAACREELSYSEATLQSEEFRFFAIEVGGVVAGFYALQRLKPTLAELEALFVEPEHIGKGLGHLLIEHAKIEARKLGAMRLVIQGDPHAERFYLATGGVRIGSKESASIPGRFLPIFSIDLL